MPKPYQKPHPPLWMACSRRESILQAARLGVGALTFSFVSPEEARQWVKDYYWTIENECEPIGYAVNPQFAIACPFLCDRNEQRVNQIANESYGFFIYGLGHYSFFGAHAPASYGHLERVQDQSARIRATRGTHAGLRRHARNIAGERCWNSRRSGSTRCSASLRPGTSLTSCCALRLNCFPAKCSPNSRNGISRSARQKAELRARISEKAMARKPLVEVPSERIVIRAAGHH